jgi:hypothetical protein
LSTVRVGLIGHVLDEVLGDTFEEALNDECIEVVSIDVDVLVDRIWIVLLRSCVNNCQIA